MPMHQMDEYDQAMADAIRQAINNASNNTARSAQSRDYYLGISNLGHCRQYAALMTKQTPFSDEREKQAAFFGTAAGAAIEAQLKVDFPDWLIQKETKTVFVSPSGYEVRGTGDVVVPSWAATDVFPQGVYDLKSKAELDTIRQRGRSKQQMFQLHALASAMIREGKLDPEKPIRVADMYFDRSGRVAEPHVIGSWYDPDVVLEIDEWIGDVIYAVQHGEDASRDQEREFCMNYCEYFTVCRGLDTDVTGLIRDPDVLSALEVYLTGKELAKEGERMKESAKGVLSKVSGSTGEYSIRNTWQNGSSYEVNKQGHFRLSITPVKPPAPPKKASKK